MVVSAIVLATSVALSPAPRAGSHGHSPPATQVDRGRGHRHPVESGRRHAAAHKAHRPALHTSLRQVRESDWVLVVRPQHRRLLPAPAPAQPRLLEPGFLAHRTGLVANGYVQIYDDRGKSWVSIANLQPATEPAGWDKLVLKIHPILRPRVTVPPPLPVANTVPAASTGTVAATPQPVVVQQQVVVQPVVQQAAPVVYASIPDEIVAAGDAAWGPGQGQALLWIAMRESGANPYAVNPSSGACGIAQRLPCSVPLGNAPVQIADMVQYVAQRYGTASAAQLFWEQHSWY